MRSSTMTSTRSNSIGCSTDTQGERVMERPLTHNIRPGEAPLDVKQYERAGGYQAARKVLDSMAPHEVTELVKEANLRGRGGAGFPTGSKWSFVPMGDDAPHPKYLIANADEMEPGTFKDRLLLEGDPHQLLEGMITSAYAIQADVAYIFLRAEYTQAERLLTRAIAEAYDAGLLGDNILGSGYSLELRLHTSAGRYMCGEETGLLNALEGKRATPRARPPFPQVSGLWGKPTIVNNVETLCNVPHIIDRGADWFLNLGPKGSNGPKLFCVSGPVNRPGCYEHTMALTVRELIEHPKFGGGMRKG